MHQVDTIIPLEDKRKFIKLGKEYFLFDPVELNLIKESQNNNRLFALNLPPEYSENFLSPNNLTLYTLDYLKYVREKQPDLKFEKETIREHILRWFLSKDNKEKEGIFTYLLKVSKTRNLSLIDEIILTTFFVREEGRISDENLIEDKLNYVLSLPSHPTLNILNQVLLLAKVFHHIKRSEWETAQYSLNDLESDNGLPINTMFYSMITKLNMNELDDAKILLNSIILYDKDRLNYAISNYHVKFYDLMLHNSFSTNIFEYSEGTVFTDILNTLYSIAHENIQMLPEIGKYFKLLQHNRYNQLKSEETEKKVEFLKIISIKYSTSKNYFFLSTIPTLRTEIFKLTEEILANIKKYYDDIVFDSLKPYDDKIATIKDALARSERDTKTILEKEEEKNKRLTKEFEDKISGEIKYYQEMFDNYDSQTDHSAIAVFKNAFAYNLIFALFVVLAGGFAEYSNYYLHEINNLAGFLSIVITGGLKWGFISFILGSIVSIIAFLNNMYDRYSAKNRLSQRINSLELEKERAKTAFLAKVEEKRKTIIERMEKTKEKMTNEIKELQETKLEEKQKKIESLAEEKKSYTAPLLEILPQ